MRRFPVFLLCLTLLAAACASPGAPEADARDGLSDADVAFLDTLQERTFRFFWDVANPANGLVPDRWPTKSFSSVAAIGFAIPGYAVGAERGWITRGQAADRVLTTLRFLRDAPQGPEPSGVAGHRGSRVASPATAASSITSSTWTPATASRRWSCRRSIPHC